MNKKTLTLVCGLLAAWTLAGCEDDGSGGSMEPGTGMTGTGDTATTGTDDGAAGAGGAVSLGAPAMCSSGDDCPDGIECVLPAGGSIGFCNVDDTEVSGGGEGTSTDGEGDAPISLGAPAPCVSDADCGDATCNEELGYCQVEEMRAEP